MGGTISELAKGSWGANAEKETARTSAGRQFAGRVVCFGATREVVHEGRRKWSRTPSGSTTRRGSLMLGELGRRTPSPPLWAPPGSTQLAKNGRVMGSPRDDDLTVQGREMLILRHSLLRQQQAHPVLGPLLAGDCRPLRARGHPARPVHPRGPHASSPRSPRPSPRHERQVKAVRDLRRPARRVRRSLCQPSSFLGHRIWS